MKENIIEENGENTGTKKVGKSKLQGFKNFFGAVDENLKEDVKKAKEKLKNLYAAVKPGYKKLDPDNLVVYKDQYGDQMSEALTALRQLCSSANKKEEGTGREFGAWMFDDFEQKGGAIQDLGKKGLESFLDGTALLMTLYENCKRTSAIPYTALKDAVTICEKYYVYLEAYSKAIAEQSEKFRLAMAKNLFPDTQVAIMSKALDKYDSKVNNQMKEKITGKVGKTKDWLATKTKITFLTKGILGLLLMTVTIPIWGPVALIWLLIRKLKKPKVYALSSQGNIY